MKKNLIVFLFISLAIVITYLTGCKKKSDVPHPYTIGQSYGGGIIFYIDASWQHGLICASSDQGSTKWGCDLTLIGGTSTVIGTGKANTTAILNKCGTTANAASICDQYSVTVGSVTYDDWYLPSIEELNQIFIQKILNPSYTIGYWSSSESDAFNMRATTNGNSQPTTASKDYSTCNVRPVRSF